MTCMGFSVDPGPLPFVTIRDAKWHTRLAYLPTPVRIHGENGCAMPRGIAAATHVERCKPGSAPHVYRDNRPLVAVQLEKPQPCAGPHAWDREWGMCAHCGEPIPTDEVNHVR